MRPTEMLVSFVNREKKERELGRYWATDIYKIVNRYLTPNNFFAKQKINLWGAENILVGEAMEEKLHEIFQFNKGLYEYQQKKVINIDDIELVAVADFNFKSKILETKFPDKPMGNVVPDKWKYQLEVLHRVFLKPVSLVIMRKHPLYTEVKYEPNDQLWEYIQDTLKVFHKKLCQNIKKNDKSKD